MVDDISISPSTERSHSQDAEGSLPQDEKVNVGWQRRQLQRAKAPTRIEIKRIAAAARALSSHGAATFVPRCSPAWRAAPALNSLEPMGTPCWQVSTSGAPAKSQFEKKRSVIVSSLAALLVEFICLVLFLAPTLTQSLNLEARPGGDLGAAVAATAKELRGASSARRCGGSPGRRPSQGGDGQWEHPSRTP